MARSELHDLAFPMLALAGLTTLVAAPFDLISTFDSAPLSEAVTTVPYLLSGLIALVSSVFLAVAVAGLADHDGPGGRRLGRAALVLGLLAAISAVYLQVIHTFILPTFAAIAPDAVNGPPTGLAAVAVAGGLGFAVIGLVTLAVSAFRTRVFPRPAAVLIAVGILGFLTGGFSTLVLGAGLLWAGVAGMRTRTAMLAAQPA